MNYETNNIIKTAGKVGSVRKNWHAPPRKYISGFNLIHFTRFTAHDESLPFKSIWGILSDLVEDLPRPSYNNTVVGFGQNNLSGSIFKAIDNNFPVTSISKCGAYEYYTGMLVFISKNMGPLHELRAITLEIYNFKTHKIRHETYGRTENTIEYNFIATNKNWAMYGIDTTADINLDQINGVRFIDLTLNNILYDKKTQRECCMGLHDKKYCKQYLPSTGSCDVVMKAYCKDNSAPVCGCINSELNNIPNVIPACADPKCIINGYKDQYAAKYVDNCPDTITCKQYFNLSDGDQNKIKNTMTINCGTPPDPTDPVTPVIPTPVIPPVNPADPIPAVPVNYSWLMIILVFIIILSVIGGIKNEITSSASSTRVGNY